MIQMIRSILPVGQGAFYLEQFKLDVGKINVVYDCGSGTSVNLIKRQIDDVFDPGEEVHAVFISHLDMDHVNGIEHLLKHCHVRHIFFPLVTRKAIPLLLLNCFCKSGKADPESFVFRFIEDPLRAVENIHREANRMTDDVPPTILHPVLSYLGEGRHRDDENDEDEELYQRESENFRLIRSGESADRLIMDDAYDEWSEYLQWRYIPFNFKQEERLNRLTDALRYEFGDLCDPKDLVDRCIKNPAFINQIRKAYNAVPGTHNSNSLVLFSGNDSRATIQHKIIMDCCENTYPCHCCAKLAPSGCLYTGDYEAAGKREWHELETALSKYFDHIGCMQLPHHGSRHNFNPEFLELRHCKFYFASAGYRNRYGHPSTSVIREILYSGKYPMIVTERSKFGCWFSIRSI